MGFIIRQHLCRSSSRSRSLALSPLTHEKMLLHYTIKQLHFHCSNYLEFPEFFLSQIANQLK